MYIDPYNHVKLILESKNTKKSKINQISNIVFDAYCRGQNDTKQEFCDLLGVKRIDRYNNDEEK